MKLWTLEEAQATIGRVEQMLQEVEAVGNEASALASRMAQLTDLPDLDDPTSATHHEFATLAAELKDAQDRFEDSSLRFHQQGIFLKGTDLVDFPSQMGDRIVLLCYHRGEGQIRHWHSQEGGFASRQPIPSFVAPDQ